MLGVSGSPRAGLVGASFAGLVSLFHRFDVRAFAWDTQEVRHIRAVLKMGIDAIYCDRPDRMVATVSEWTTGSEE